MKDQVSSFLEMSFTGDVIKVEQEKKEYTEYWDKVSCIIFFISTKRSSNPISMLDKALLS